MRCAVAAVWGIMLSFARNVQPKSKGNEMTKAMMITAAAAMMLFVGCGEKE